MSASTRLSSWYWILVLFEFYLPVETDIEINQVGKVVELLLIFLILLLDTRSWRAF
jgi:hypothetical protein